MIALPYISLVLLFFIRHYASNAIEIYQKSEKLFIYFVLWIFFGFRGYIFTDCFGYASFFTSVPNIIDILQTNFLRYTWWEPGYVCYCGIIKLFTNNWIIFQLIDSTIDLFILHKSLEYFNSERAINIVIFLAMSGMISFIDLFRNIKAILLFFYGLRYIYERRIIKYYLLCLIALSFHKSAIFYFLCYPIFRVTFSKKKFLYIGIISILIAFFSKTIFLFLNSIISVFLPIRLQNAINDYVMSDNSMSVGRVLSLGVIEKIITFFLIYFNYKTIEKEEKGSLLIKSFLLYFITYFCFAGMNEVSNRVSMLFIFSYWCIIPLIIKKKNKLTQYIYVICILLYCLLKISLYNQPIQKYENWLFGASSFSERQLYNNSF